MDSTQRDDHQPDLPATPELSGKGAARRRIGLGVSGLIMTLASKPGMATNPMYCGTASGWQSASTASRTKSDAGKCTGLSAGYWIHHTWPSTCRPRAYFSTIFPEGKGIRYTDGPLYDVLTNNSNTADPWNLRREFVCAYLNAAAGLNTHPSMAELKAIWAAYAPTGSYRVVSTGAVLNGEQLKNFLASSHDGT